jgi:hypothetical protein
MTATSKSRNYWRYGRNIMTGTLAAVAMVALGVSQAQAVDGKLYPASMCVRWGGSPPLLKSSKVINIGTTDLALDCPAVHDFIDESIQDGYVDVIDNHRTRPVCANLVSVSQFSSSSVTERSTGWKCTTGFGFQSKRLSFGGLAADPNAHYFYSVQIPPPDNGLTSAIISYEVDEND